MQKKNEYMQYLDLLRVISSFMVVMIHVTAKDWGNSPVTSSEWQVMNIFDCLTIPSVPIFFMISGALFLNEEYEISLRKLYGKKILHLFIIYHLWLLFYNLLPFFRGELAWTYKNIKFEVIFDVLEGRGIYHLWFIPQLIMLYIVTPVIKNAFRKKEVCQYFLIVYILLGTLLPAMLLYDFPYKRFVRSYYERTTLVMVTGYIGYYVAGHYINSFTSTKLTKRKRRVYIVIAVLGYILTIVACSIDAIQKNEPSVILNTPFATPHFLTTLCIYSLVRSGYSSMRIRSGSWIRELSKLSFGIYLIHPFVIDIVKSIGLCILKPHPIVMIPVFTGIVYAVSGLIVLMLKKIPIVRKIVS